MPAHEFIQEKIKHRDLGSYSEHNTIFSYEEWIQKMSEFSNQQNKEQIGDIATLTKRITEMDEGCVKKITALILDKKSLSAQLAEKEKMIEGLEKVATRAQEHAEKLLTEKIDLIDMNQKNLIRISELKELYIKPIELLKEIMEGTSVSAMGHLYKDGKGIRQRVAELLLTESDKQGMKSFIINFYWAKSFKRSLYWCNNKKEYFYIGHRIPNGCCELIHEFERNPIEEVLVNYIKSITNKKKT